MKKTKSFIFESPKIIGILSEKTVPDSFQKKIALILKKRKLPYVCLPFVVDARYLKNVIACVRLMDITGLLVTGKHVKSIWKFLPKLADSAQKTNRVTVVSRHKNSFLGHYIPINVPDDMIDLLISSL